MAQKIQGLVDGDAIKPGGKRRLALKGIKTLPYFQESILQHIIGIFMSDDNLTNLPVQQFALVAHKSLKPLTPGAGIGYHVGHFLVTYHHSVCFFIIDKAAMLSISPCQSHRYRHTLPCTHLPSDKG